MEELLSNIASNSSLPILTAFVLGLMTAISPCPLATNITAIGFISKDIEDKSRVFKSGLIYTLGRALSYTILALVIFIGADQFQISAVFQQYGEKFIGPILVIIGVFMLGIINFNFLSMDKLIQKTSKNGIDSYWKVFLLGVLFALAFCPYSGVLYFGMLIPITITSPSGFILASNICDCNWNSSDVIRMDHCLFCIRNWKTI